MIDIKDGRRHTGWVAALWEDRFYVALGRRVRRRREDRHLSQATVARHLGLTRTSVTNMEAGRQRLQVHQLAALATLLQVGTADLVPALDGIEPVNPYESRDSEAISQVLAAAEAKRGA